MFLVTFFNHLALKKISTLFQCWSNNCHYFNHISTLKIGHVPAGFQPFSIKRCFNVVSTLKQQLTLFQPYFNVEGRSCAGWGVNSGKHKSAPMGWRTKQNLVRATMQRRSVQCVCLPHIYIWNNEPERAKEAMWTAISSCGAPFLWWEE